MSLNLDTLKDEVEGIVRDNVDGLLEGAADDVANYVAAITNDLSAVWTVEDPDRREALLAELLGQLKAVGELNRIRAVEAGWDTFQRVVSAVTRTAIGALIAAV